MNTINDMMARQNSHSLLYSPLVICTGFTTLCIFALYVCGTFVNILACGTNLWTKLFIGRKFSQCHLWSYEMTVIAGFLGILWAIISIIISALILDAIIYVKKSYDNAQKCVVNTAYVNYTDKFYDCKLPKK